MYIFIKRTARQLSSFLSLKKMLPTPTGFCHPRHTRYAAAQEWSAGLYRPCTLAHLPVLYEGVQASPGPTMFTPTIAFEPNKGIGEVVDWWLIEPCTCAEGRTHGAASV